MKLFFVLLSIFTNQLVLSQDSAMYVHKSTIMIDRWKFLSTNGMKSGKVIEYMEWDDGQIISGSGVFVNYSNRVVLDSLTFTRTFREGFGPSTKDTAWTPWFKPKMIFYKSQDHSVIASYKKLLRRKTLRGYDIVFRKESMIGL